MQLWRVHPVCPVPKFGNKRSQRPPTVLPPVKVGGITSLKDDDMVWFRLDRKFEAYCDLVAGAVVLYMGVIKLKEGCCLTINRSSVCIWKAVLVRFRSRRRCRRERFFDSLERRSGNKEGRCKKSKGEKSTTQLFAGQHHARPLPAVLFYRFSELLFGQGRHLVNTTVQQRQSIVRVMRHQWRLIKSKHGTQNVNAKD